MIVLPQTTAVPPLSEKAYCQGLWRDVGGGVLLIWLSVSLGQNEVFFKDFTYLFERERERERDHEWGGREKGEGEADILLSREPDVGLNLRTLGS